MTPTHRHVPRHRVPVSGVPPVVNSTKIKVSPLIFIRATAHL